MVDLNKYLTQSLNMALGTATQGETSYTNSFDCKISDNGFYFIPRLPAGYVIDDNLYNKIFLIANTALYPKYTLIKQNSIYLVSINTNDIHIQRALFFPWKKGIPERLIIPNLDIFIRSYPNNMYLMKNTKISYDKITSILIAGNSGSGKSYTLTYFLAVLKNISDLIIVDPKFDTPSRWARENNIKIIHPSKNRSKSDFVSEVNDALSTALNIIQERQEELYSNPKSKHKHYTIVIDELMALSEGVNKPIKEAFFSLLSQVALLGRATKVHLLLVSQRFDHTSIPVSVREQANLLIQLGNINSKTTQFLFPDLNPEGIVIPTGKGTGLIQIIDAEEPYQVLPFLSPTYYTKGDIL